MEDLERFLQAQEPVYERVRAELQAGRKTSHWMWFIFPQLKGLGRSPTAQYFGIASLQEAVAYWQHPVLGTRLEECTRLVLAVVGNTAHEIFGFPDDLKFASCMTLFEQAAPEQPVFGRALDKYFQGKRDENTLRLLRQRPPDG
jgi:uncharacterized protein (DUF1810 family)